MIGLNDETTELVLDNDRKLIWISWKGTDFVSEKARNIGLVWVIQGLRFPIWMGYFQDSLSTHMKNHLSILEGKAGQILILHVY